MMYKLLWLFGFASLSVLAADVEVSAYLTGKYKSSEDIVKLLNSPALKKKGYEYLGAAKVNQSSDYTVILFTTKKLLEKASKEKRGFAAVQRIMVNNSKIKKEVMVANPHYFLRAFLQDDYEKGLAEEIYADLTTTEFLGKLAGNEDKLKQDDLSDYQFMAMMPEYDDFEEVGEVDEDMKDNKKNRELIKRFEKKVGKEQIVFKKKLKDSVLYGVTLPSEIESFVTTLGVPHKSILLPYTVLIEKGEAKILHAKYYLAISLPKLSMGEFMEISDIPGKIEDQFEAYFEPVKKDE